MKKRVSLIPFFFFLVFLAAYGKCSAVEITTPVILSDGETLDYSGQDVIIKNGGSITVDPSYGSFTVIARSLIIEEGGSIFTDGGTIIIEISGGDLTNQGEIRADSFGEGGCGKGGCGEGGCGGGGCGGAPERGTVSIDIRGGTLINQGKITAINRDGCNGDGGLVEINVDGEDLVNEGQISTDSYGSKGCHSRPESGDITISATGNITNSGEITAINREGSNGWGGSITVEGNYDVTISFKAFISADSYGSKGRGGYPNGGTINLTAASKLTIAGTVTAIATKYNGPGTITLTYCANDFTGATFDPAPIENIRCPAAPGIPHFVYGKVFNSGGLIPSKDNLEICAYILARPDEILDKSSVGCGYDIWFDGWLWFEAGNFVTPWSINENLRVIAIDNLLQETGETNLTLDSSGNQLLSDLTLASGDNVGPIASSVLADGLNPLTIPEGTGGISLTATIDDSITGGSAIQNAEYFIDTDPSLGSGTGMDAVDGVFDELKEDIEATVNTSSWTEGSTHTIYVRGMDATGNWGTTHQVVIYVSSPW